MRTIQVNLYQLDELDAKAKARARQWYRDCNAGDNDFADAVIEDATEIANRMGIDIGQQSHRTAGGKTWYEPRIFWSGFWNQGDGASFEGTYSASDQPASFLVKEHAPQDETLHRIAERLDLLQGKHDHKLTASITRTDTRYAHAYTMQIDVAIDGDDDKAVPTEDKRELLNAFRDLANWIYRGLEDSYNYANSDEQIDEIIRLNEYEFYSNGERARS
ncbi:antitoxin of toxin-antitoxin stability system [Bradyrhizobium sp. PMVTL-01]|uniref:antitoxin of toxin-antitoxin stability system n=1 Tax=Bradyrhizobium sp. PMVTL-01 TaxID=3434999 RepID=UPI003F70D4F9